MLHFLVDLEESTHGPACHSSPTPRQFSLHERQHYPHLRDMPNNEATIFGIVQAILLVVIAVLALIYSLPILCIRRFQHRNNIFALNVCLTAIAACIVCTLVTAVPSLSSAFKHFTVAHSWLSSVQASIGLSMILSFVLVALHRCCSILYHQQWFFRSKQWVMICLVSQWVVASIASIPHFVSSLQVRLVAVELSLMTISLYFCSVRRGDGWPIMDA